MRTLEAMEPAGTGMQRYERWRQSDLMRYFQVQTNEEIEAAETAEAEMYERQQDKPVQVVDDGDVLEGTGLGTAVQNGVNASWYEKRWRWLQNQRNLGIVQNMQAYTTWQAKVEHDLNVIYRGVTNLPERSQQSLFVFRLAQGLSGIGLCEFMQILYEFPPPEGWSWSISTTCMSFEMERLTAEDRTRMGTDKQFKSNVRFIVDYPIMAVSDRFYENQGGGEVIDTRGFTRRYRYPGAATQDVDRFMTNPDHPYNVSALDEEDLEESIRILSGEREGSTMEDMFIVNDVYLYLRRWVPPTFFRRNIVRSAGFGEKLMKSIYMFQLGETGCSVFIPEGFGNCLNRVILEAARRTFGIQYMEMDSMDLTQHHMDREMDALCKDLLDFSNKKRKQLIKHSKRRREWGYTNKMIQILNEEVLMKKGFYIRKWVRRVKRDKSEWWVLGNKQAEPRVGEKPWVFIDVVDITMDGCFFRCGKGWNNRSLEQEEEMEEEGDFVHAIWIQRYDEEEIQSNSFLCKRHTDAMEEAIRERIEHDVYRFWGEDHVVESSELEEWIGAQQKRIRQGLVDTLIYGKGIGASSEVSRGELDISKDETRWYEDEETGDLRLHDLEEEVIFVMDRDRKRKRDARERAEEGRPNGRSGGGRFECRPPALFVFDLESAPFHQEEFDLIPEGYRIPVLIPEEENEQYAIMTVLAAEGQVPYAASWARISMKEMVQEENAEKVEQWVRSSMHVRTEKGPVSCIESMLDGMFENMAQTRVKHGIAFAHNGSRFDFFLLMQSLRKYKLPKSDRAFLKTGRGILSMSITKEIGDQTYRLTFRDTIVHASASLMDLCKLYGTPQDLQKIEDFGIERYKLSDYEEKEHEWLKYAQNDVYSLAYLVRGINLQYKQIGLERCCYNGNIPVTQFLTNMSAIKGYLRMNIPRERFPIALDLHVLRLYVRRHLNGGRVTPYARTFVSQYFKSVWELVQDQDPTKEENMDKQKEVWDALLKSEDYSVVLDATSLYPTAMNFFPYPYGEPSFASIYECMDAIDRVGCGACLERGMVCDVCKDARYPYVVVFIKKLRPTEKAKRNGVVKCQRRLTNDEGVYYGLETPEELIQRTKGKKSFYKTDCYSAHDAFWLREEGYTFKIIGGIQWETDYMFRTLVQNLFQKRREAKERNDKVMDAAYKLLLNGKYGVHAQKDIDSRYMVQDEGLSVNHKYLHKEIDKNKSFGMNNGQWMIREKLSMGETYGQASPNQIGGAVLSFARHVMNLAFYSLRKKDRDSFYTDTDSNNLYAKSMNKLMRTHPQLFDPRGQQLGTFKNDLGEGLCLFSFFLTKKCKVNFTWDGPGKPIKTHITWKGFKLVDREDWTREDMEKIRLGALMDIFYRGEMRYAKFWGGYPQSKWERSMMHGVTIHGSSNPVYMSSDESTFCDFAKATVFHKQGRIERYVYHGQELDEEENWKKERMVLSMSLKKTNDWERRRNHWKDYLPEALHYKKCVVDVMKKYKVFHDMEE